MGYRQTAHLIHCLLLGALACPVAIAVAPAEAQDAFRAFPLAEPSFAANLAGIDPEWNMSFHTLGKVRVVSAGDLAYWGRCRDAESGPQILLSDGGLIRADLLLMQGDELVLGDATGLGRLQWDESRLPKTAIQGVLWQPPSATTARDKLLRTLSARQEAEDCLILSGGETVVGSILALPKAGPYASSDDATANESILLRHLGNAQALQIPIAKVIAIQFAGRGQTPVPPEQPSVWLGFADGSLVRAKHFSIKADTIAVTLAAGGELKTTLTDRKDPERKIWDALTYIEPVQPRVAWLSDLVPLGYKQIPFLSVERPFGTDHNVLGFRLRASRSLFRKGLGMPTAARLAYDVTAYRKLEAEIAVDDRAELRGSVIFKVLLEAAPNQWQSAYESPIVRGGDAPLPISIDLKGATRLALLTDFADHGDECDYADWLNARLIK